MFTFGMQALDSLCICFCAHLVREGCRHNGRASRHRATDSDGSPVSTAGAEASWGDPLHFGLLIIANLRYHEPPEDCLLRIEASMGLYPSLTMCIYLKVQTTAHQHLAFSLEPENSKLGINVHRLPINSCQCPKLERSVVKSGKRDEVEEQYITYLILIVTRECFINHDK